MVVLPGMNEVGPIVFVVDDDPSVREGLDSLFRSIKLAVQTFGTAEEFLRFKRPDAPGCIVLDVRLPGLNGLDFQDELVESNVDLPIVFITGHGDVTMSVRAIKAGAVDFLMKPFRHQDLIDAIYSAIDRHRLRRKAEATALELSNRFALLTSRERQVMCTDLYGRQFATTNYGMLYTAKGTASLLVPLANVLTTATGNWVAVFILAAIFNIVAAVMALFVLKPMRIRTIGQR